MKLAIEGGTPAIEHDLPAWPYYDQAEDTALLRSLHQGQWWRVGGVENERF